MKKLFWLSLFLFVAPLAHAAGGACPTGSNYPSTDVATPAAFTTLAGDGITSCYYIAANGSDTNTGLDEAHPWLHAPEMLSCSGNCALLQNSNTMNGAAAAGLGFILRGGDTWHLGITTDSAGQPSAGGMWNWNSGPNGKFPNGTTAHPIYVGVDKNWFSGTSWTRPVLTGDNPICSVGTLSGTCTTYSSVGGNGQSDGSNRTVQVSSCLHQVGSRNSMVSFDSRTDFIFDNFELTGLCQDGTIPNKQNTYLTYNGANGPFWNFNNYIHGWSHVPWSMEPPNGGCDSTTQVCFGVRGFGGSGPVGHGDHFRYVVMDGFDSDPIGGGADIAGYEDVAYSVFRYQSEWIGRSNTHLIHDNLIEFFWDNGHTDAGMLGEAPTGVHAYYNNIWRHNYTFQPGAPGTGARGGVALWNDHAVAASVGAYTVYTFNNLMWETFGQSWDVSADQGGISGHLIAFNNTLEKNSAGAIISCSTGTTKVAPVTLVSNFWIHDNSPYDGNCTLQFTAAPLNEKTLSHTQATTAPNGYTASEAFAYSPGGASWASVGGGVNQTSGYCANMATAAASDPSLTDAAAACLLDTRYGPAYDSVKHAVTGSARAPIARPASGAWDIGAYQFAQTQSAPLPPTNLQATVL